MLRNFLVETQLTTEETAEAKNKKFCFSRRISSSSLVVLVVEVQEFHSFCFKYKNLQQIFDIEFLSFCDLIRQQKSLQIDWSDRALALCLLHCWF